MTGSFSPRLIVLAFMLAGCSSATESSPDLGAPDLGPSCGCAKSSDCASGICCVGNANNAGGSYCAKSLADCHPTYFGDGWTTIACEQDSDCAGVIDRDLDGGVRQSKCLPAAGGICGAPICNVLPF
jgi:hypothetical protein